LATLPGFPRHRDIISYGLPSHEHDEKCLLAQEKGTTIHKLVFLAKPGAARVHNQPGRSAIARFVLSRFDIQIIVEELVDPELA
jgi:hypothetical protein